MQQDLHGHWGLGEWVGGSWDIHQNLVRAHCVCRTQGEPLTGPGWVLRAPPPHGAPQGEKRLLDASWKEGLKIALLPAPARLPAASGQVTWRGYLAPSKRTCPETGAWKNRCFLTASPCPFPQVPPEKEQREGRGSRKQEGIWQGDEGGEGAALGKGIPSPARWVHHCPAHKKGKLRQKKGGQRGSPFSFLVQTPSPGHLAQVPALEAAPG